MTPEEYATKRQARYERLLAASQKAEGKSNALLNQSHAMASVIPFGQPILVGHHSEGRDRRYRARIENKSRKGYELHQKAEALRKKAEATQKNRAIFSDDPNATEKLEAKISRLEERQRLIVAANRLVRKEDREGLAILGFGEAYIAKLFTPDFCGRVGFPDYEIKNNGVNIRRLKQRVTHIEDHANDETTELTIGEVTIIDDVNDNRLKVIFPDKPSAEVRTKLKSHVFVFSYTNNAWQRHRSNQAMYWAKVIAEELTTKDKPGTTGS